MSDLRGFFKVAHKIARRRLGILLHADLLHKISFSACEIAGTLQLYKMEYVPCEHAFLAVSNVVFGCGIILKQRVNCVLSDVVVFIAIPVILSVQIPFTVLSLFE